MRVAQKDKAMFRNEKGDVWVNVLVFCDESINIVYIVIGWYGSIVDSRALRNAVTRVKGSN